MAEAPVGGNAASGLPQASWPQPGEPVEGNAGDWQATPRPGEDDPVSLADLDRLIDALVGPRLADSQVDAFFAIL